MFINSDFVALSMLRPLGWPCHFCIDVNAVIAHEGPNKADYALRQFRRDMALVRISQIPSNLEICGYVSDTKWLILSRGGDRPILTRSNFQSLAVWKRSCC